MNVRDTIGQLLMVGFSGTELSPECIDWLQEHRPGGVILFSRNLVDAEQVARLTNSLQAHAPNPPLLIAIDQEGGRVSRLPQGFTIFPSASTVAACQSPDVAYGHAWGLSWRLQPANGSSYFGDLISPGSFGHGGATGTVVWADPARDMVCVLFTTEPSANSEGLLGRCSNLVAAAIM